jgi:hypothetical protein
LTPARSSHRSVLDELLGPTERERPAGPQPASEPPPTAEPSPAPSAGRRLRLTVGVEPALIELARTVVFYSPGLTMVGFISQAIRAEVARREAERGEPFPSSRRGSIRTGRPIR